MSDGIVSRLKSPEVFISIGGMTSLVAHEAADLIEAKAAEIARLRARIAELEEALKINFHKHVQGASAADVIITRILPYSVSDAELKRLTGGKKDE